MDEKSLTIYGLLNKALEQKLAQAQKDAHDKTNAALDMMAERDRLFEQRNALELQVAAWQKITGFKSIQQVPLVSGAFGPSMKELLSQALARAEELQAVIDKMTETQAETYARAEKAEAQNAEFRIFIEDSCPHYGNDEGEHVLEKCEKCSILRDPNPGQPLLDRLAKVEAENAELRKLLDPAVVAAARSLDSMEKLTAERDRLAAVVERLLEAIDAAPSSAGNHIVFEGCDVVTVGPEDLDDLHAAAEAARRNAT